MSFRFAISILLAICALGVPACSKAAKDELANVPENMNSASADAAIDEPSSLVIVITNGGKTYVGETEIVGEPLTELIKQRLANRPEDKRIVYVKGDLQASFGHMVETLKSIRAGDVDRVGLVVKSVKSRDAAYRFEIRLPAAPVTKTMLPGEVQLEQVDTSPDLLRVSIAADGQLKLNNQDQGTVANTSILGAKISEVIKQRQTFGSDAKTVIVYGSRTISYGDMAKVIDAIAAAGGLPIRLALDKEAPPQSTPPKPEVPIDQGAPSGQGVPPPAPTKE